MRHRFRYNSEAPIMAADVGGTNTTISVLQVRDRQIKLLDVIRFPSQELERFDDAVESALSRFRADGIEPKKIAISAAGPISKGVCSLTNLPWKIESEQTGKRFGLETILMNDFSAISYGIPLLSTEDPAQLVPVPRSDGTVLKPQPGIRVVLGAGTGLGVGYLEDSELTTRVWSSEGGHTDFPPFDDETEQLARYIRERSGRHPDWEQVLSGPAIPRIFGFLLQTGRYTRTARTAQITASPVTDQPRLISGSRDACPVAARTMELFVTFYGRAAGNMALQFLPPGGVYLAGGIVAKNLELFIEDRRFIEAFETTYLDKLADRLKATPVYIVREYTISLYGAAHAALLQA